jgi:N-acetylneuraminate synthase
VERGDNVSGAILAIIPVCGQQSMPRRDLQPVAGRPLIAWTVSAARTARTIDRVVVSTDDEEIAAYARAAGAEVPVVTPQEGCSPAVSAIDVTVDTVRWLAEHESYRADLVIVLPPTSPLRTADDIDAAVARLHESGGDALISVASESTPGGVIAKASADEVLGDGAILVVRRDVLLERRTLSGVRPIAYFMPPERSLSVDSTWDLLIADAALRRRPVTPIQVGPRSIGGGRCFIIAELGVNHNGSVELAERLIDAAADTGADAVKLQTWNTDELVTPDAPLAEYQRSDDGPSSQYELLKGLELPVEALARLKQRAEARGLEFFSTADDETSADVLDRLGVRLFKIGSAELTNHGLLQHVAAKRKPVIISTGMATLEEVESAMTALAATGNRQLAILHCVSAYPSPPEESNLKALDTLAGFGVPVGFSDHTLGNALAIAAVARGAAIIEKHFTIDKSLPGPDHRASAEPHEFREMVSAARAVERGLGDGLKHPTPSEIPVREVVRRVVVAARHLAAGHVIAAGDVVLRRAGSGLSPAELESVLGRILREDVGRHEPITRDLLADGTTGHV